MEKPYEYVLVLTTCSSDEEAGRIATALVSEKTAACCNIVKDVRSIYFWQGKLEDDREVLLIIKTTYASFPRVREMIGELHSYDVPEIIALPIIDGSEDYLNWVSEQTKP
jgi:periplasmic divalent cation tolerance protein